MEKKTKKKNVDLLLKSTVSLSAASLGSHKVLMLLHNFKRLSDYNGLQEAPEQTIIGAGAVVGA